MVYAARYHFQNGEPVREGDYFAGDIRGLVTIIKAPAVMVGPNANYYREILKRENETAQDKVEAVNIKDAGNNLHNVIKPDKNEPAQSWYIGGQTISITAIENEPAGASVAYLAALRFAGGKQDDALSLTPMYLKESTAKVFVNKYLKNK
jgi:hypothetical protein